jgi:hypothetical protein
MRRCSSGVLMFLAVGVAFGQQGKTPQTSSDIPILRGYKRVEWPTQATSAAGFPAGPWNFIQVTAVALLARGNILLLHRGAHPVMEFEPGGKFVRSWGDGMFSDGKVVGIPVPNRTPDRSDYTAVYGPAGCTSCGAHSVRVGSTGEHLVGRCSPTSCLQDGPTR